MRPVERWTGAEAHALRQALRLSVRAFAEHLGVAPRTVAKWDAGRTSVNLRLDTQAILDSALAQAPEEAQSRFAAIAAQQRAIETSAEEDANVRRREFLGGAVAILGSAPSPRMANRASPSSASRVGKGDIEAVREMTTVFSRMDQRHGGGHASTAVSQYLTSDVAKYLDGRFPSEQLRREMFSAAGELSYLAGWMAFDDADYYDADHFFTVALTLAAEGDDPPLEGHVLRAMAHKSLDLGEYRRGMELADASVQGKRFGAASSRERALTGVVHGRALAVNGHHREATAALLAAENDLVKAEGTAEEEPSRVFFFGEASLAHETANALRGMGDTTSAIREFRRSVAKRKVVTFKRTHAVTLGYLGSTLALAGDVDEACVSWNAAIDSMDGVKSSRARRVIADIRSHLSQIGGKRGPEVVEIERRATAYLTEGA
jgi:transcriptional regulator with XRE-family HTH domain